MLDFPLAKCERPQRRMGNSGPEPQTHVVPRTRDITLGRSRVSSDLSRRLGPMFSVRRRPLPHSTGSAPQVPCVSLNPPPGPWRRISSDDLRAPNRRRASALVYDGNIRQTQLAGCAPLCRIDKVAFRKLIINIWTLFCATMCPYLLRFTSRKYKSNNPSFRTGRGRSWDGWDSKQRAVPADR